MNFNKFIRCPMLNTTQLFQKRSPVFWLLIGLCIFWGLSLIFIQGPFYGSFIVSLPEVFNANLSLNEWVMILKPFSILILIFICPVSLISSIVCLVRRRYNHAKTFLLVSMISFFLFGVGAGYMGHQYQSHLSDTMVKPIITFAVFFGITGMLLWFIKRYQDIESRPPLS